MAETHDEIATRSGASVDQLQGILERALGRNIRDEHSLAIVHADGLTARDAGRVHGALAKIARTLGGVVSLTPISEDDFVFFMEGWTVKRALTVARLVRVSVRRTEFTDPDALNVRIELFPVRGTSVDVQALIDQTRRSFCSTDPSGIEIINNQKI